MITRLISGGQTGADRAALDAARVLGIETGGWVPRGRWAEDGRVPDCYPNMKETDSADPAMRTEHNVRDSDGTVVFSHGEVSGGTKWTMEVSDRLRKPLLRLDLSRQPVEAAADRLLEWTEAEGVEVLNVAGPRASEDAAIHCAVRAVLGIALGARPFHATDLPKPFVNAEPGAILTGAQRELCRGWRNQEEVTVAGAHFIQEDSPHEIGRAVADFVRRIDE